MKEERKEKKGNNKGIVVIILLSVLLIIVAFVIALNNVGIIKFDDLNIPTTKKQKAELNYTQTTNTTKEGIYITDVSDIVEEVMPSIVAITSKTLVKSGMFGPFSSGEQYSEGAGSTCYSGPYSPSW